MQDYRKLSVWKKSYLLAIDVYKITRKFPKEETFGLTSQLRRAVVSIPANIAEGCGRGGNIELVRFLQISSGSAHELECHILLAKDIGYLRDEEFSSLDDQIGEIKRMLSSLMSKIKQDHKKS